MAQVRTDTLRRSVDTEFHTEFHMEFWDLYSHIRNQERTYG